MKSVNVNILSSILAAATSGPIVNASIVIHSVGYTLHANCPVDGPTATGQLVGNTLFDEISVPSLCRASVTMRVDPNVPQQYFSAAVYAIGNFNHGDGWDVANVTAQLQVQFSVDAEVQCSWSSSSGWGPSGGWASLSGTHGASMAGSGTALLGPGTYWFFSTAAVGALADQPINGYGSFWFAVPSPATLTLILAAGIAGRRLR